MADYTFKQPFYVFYFNPERNTHQRVEIQGFGDYHESLDKPSRVHVFVDDCSRLYDSSRFYDFANHIEDLNVNDLKLLKSSIYTPYVRTEKIDSYCPWSETADEDEDES
ncbi:unnamed protein product [Microthlaspi erraticum]|uniref:F-box associated beta-propeller type 3 domain-containing protein n=1 Tax=Microthlaspi erraticum TaxID=1685480 RepID=A0A6D2LAE2_9BRAS|nr:unnamed protein product [Microthlaspi erraticum]